MTLRSYALTESQCRILAEFCLNWNCSSLSLLIRDSDQLPVAAKDLLDALPHDDVARSLCPKWAFTLAHIDTVAQLIQICLAKQQRSPPRLYIDSGRSSGCLNFRLVVTESLIEITFANVYHAEILCMLGLQFQVQVTSLDLTTLTNVESWEPITPETCDIRFPKDMNPCLGAVDFERWPHPERTFSKYRVPSRKDDPILGWWTSRHDDLLKLAIEQNGWRWRPPVKAILAITPAEAIERLEARDRHLSGGCIRALGYFCERRGLQLEPCIAALPTLKWLICPICGRYFHQRTVARFTAFRLAVVCNICRSEAYKPEYRNWTRSEILDHIRNFVRITGGIAHRIFYLSESVLSTFSVDQYVEVIRLSRLSPSTKLVEQHFGTWFAARVEAGVIPDGWMKMSRGIRCVARDGHTCLSLGEKVICDWLFENGLPHCREVPYGGDRHYLADWEIYGHLVEYFGLTGDDKYDLKTQKKIEYAEQNGVSLIVIYPADLQNLQEAFGKFGIDQLTSDVKQAKYFLTS